MLYNQSTGVQIDLENGGYILIPTQELPAFRRWVPLMKKALPGEPIQLCDTGEDFCQDIAVQDLINLLNP